MSIFDKFKNGIDKNAINEAITEAKENGGGFKEVPEGTYEVAVEKMEIKETKKGDDMISIWFNILDGEFKGSKLFKNQVIKENWQLGQAFDFIFSLDTGIQPTEKITSSEDFQEYLDEVLDEINDKGFEYEVKYTINKKGFTDITITETFQA
ncbi:DUF669 domain-containing protein [Clostridium saccharoperbutylacetonicum]|uniref:DUF669 domain-containing protein n=1 Tax=Clostridium saccharoperbutylacetonicum TaxID=36745 RepID=UPI00098404D2|nr:DUF669 domain-containing protein [Clostridium saccharoperbutylacetonicum]AQR98134.1 hypothetical protein CLSAP_54850 [Clostridium saccharoperbutylacetonicum]NSB34027.1 hypothetical protein [Clostridium saccharoperbutylacetonicum]